MFRFEKLCLISGSPRPPSVFFWAAFGSVVPGSNRTEVGGGGNLFRARKKLHGQSFFFLPLSDPMNSVFDCTVWSAPTLFLVL